MHMPYGKSHTAGYATRNQKAKLAADYQELLKELSTTTNIQSVGNYVLEKTLGEGSYGKVKLATHKLTGRKVAIKIIPKIHAENLTREIHHHRYLHHPNIISLLEVIPTETKIYIVLEYCEGGELYDFLVVRGRLRENLARKMFGQLCRAVKYCHDRRVVHRDLKLENILLDSHNNIKLADFGFTRECESKRLLETICGSTGYSAPEMLRGNKYSGLEIDIWSLGVILYTLLCGVLPFDDDDENEMRNKIIKGEYEMEEFLSDEAKDLIRSILQLEPSERPTLKQILQHAWFKMKDEEEYDDDDDWATSDEIADDESISSIEENSVKEPIKEVTITSSSKDIHLDATSHLERQRQEIFLATKQQHNASLPNHYPTTFTRHNNSYNNNNDITSTSSIAPSAFKSRMKSFSPAAGPSPPKVLGPSTSKTSRRSSIDSKAFNEKVFFTTPEEKELLEKLENLGLDITGIKDSVLEGKVDSASGLWWLLLAKLREKRKIEGAQSSVTMVNVAVGTSDEEIEIAEETEEEYDSPENSIELDRLQEEDVKDMDSIKSSENIMSPPTPPPKTYHAAPASRERRKSLILSFPEAVEPVLTTITATASPPLSPKKYSSFTSPISSRSVSPIPSINPMPMPISNSKNAYRKRGGLLSTIKGWWGGSHNPKDVNAYKKNMLNWADNGSVVPADVAHVRSRMNRRRSGSKTPPGFEGANSFSLSRRSSSINRGSFRDKKKKKIPIQGIKGGNKRATPTPAPLMIPPVTPSIVLSQSSPTIMSPIPGTPPASRPKTLFTKNRRIPFAYQGSSRKQVKRRSINSINNLLENFNTGAGSGSSEDNTNHVNNLTNNEQKKDTFEKSAIENIISKDEHTIDEQLMVVESSKSKTITLASPPPTPPPNNKDNHSSTNPSRISKCEQVGSQNVDNRKKSEETLISNSSDGDESDVFVDAASTFTYNPISRSASPSTSASPSPNNSPVIKPEITIVSPPSFSSPQSRSPISITPPRPQSQTSPVSPPLSPIENVVVPPSSLHSKNNAHKKQVRSDASRTSFRRGKQSEENISPIEKSIPPPTKSVMSLMSTPPESPKLSKPTPSSAYLHPQSKYRQNARSYSSPAALSLNNISEDNMEDDHHHGDNNNNNNNSSSSSSSSSINGIKNIGIDNKRDSSHSPPNMNASQMMFLQNNGRNTRQRTYFNQSSSINRTSIAKPPKPAMIIEEEEEE